MWSHNRLSKIRQLGWSDWGLLLEAAVWLAFSRLALLLVPFKQISPHLGTLQHESDRAVSSATEQTAERIGWAIRAIARRTPWESACLAQAISAKAMLRRRHITSTLYLGLGKDSSQKLQAHAWLRCGTEILTGKAGHERFSIISTFTENTTPDRQQAKNDNEIVTDLHMLLLAVLNPIPQTAVAKQLRQLTHADWSTLVEIAAQQRVLTLFWAQLRELDVETAFPPHLRTKMQQQYQQVTMQNLAIYRELRLINEEMQAANIPMIVLKGPYLATAVYPHIGQRAVGDLDLLVPLELVEKTVNLLLTLDWQQTRNASLDAVRQYIYHLPAFAKKGVNFPIEIHWNVARPHSANSISPKTLWHKPEKTTLAGTEILVFPDHIQLLHLALHAAYNHQFAFDLRSLCDIAMLISQRQASIDWQALVEQAKVWNWQRGVYLTLQLVHDFWPEMAVPSQVLSHLKPAQMPDNLIELARQQLLWGRGNNKEVSPNFSQLKSNNTLSEKVKFVFYFIIPPRSRLAWLYGVPLDSPKIWFYYPLNLRNLITRNARRTWSLLRGSKRVTDAATRRTQLGEWLAQTE